MSIEPSRELNVIHCDDEGRAREIADLLQNWAEAGLVVADLWVVSGVERSAWRVRPVALVDSFHFAVEAARGEDQLGEALAARDYALLRVIHLTFVEHDDPSSSGWTEITQFVRGRLRDNVARLRLLNLLVPTSGEPRDVSRAVLRSDADLTLLVAPEDSRSSKTAWLPLSDEPEPGPRETSGWAATVAAALTGVWAGVAENPLDGEFVASVDGESPVMVARAFVRVLDGGFLVDHIGAGLIGRFDEWPYPADIERPDDLLQARPNAVQDIAGAFTAVDDGALRFKRVPRPTLPPQSSIGWLQAFRMMFRYLADVIRRAPTQFVEGVALRTQVKVAAWTQQVVFGNDSAFLVSFGGRTASGGFEGEPALTTRDVRTTAERVFSLLGDRNPPSPSPRAWRSLRALVLGLGDGAELPDIGSPSIRTMVRQGSNQLVIRSPERLAPDPSAVTLTLQPELFAPGQPLAAWDPSSMRACDPLTCLEMLGAIERSLIELEEEELELAPVGPSSGNEFRMVSMDESVEGGDADGSAKSEDAQGTVEKGSSDGAVDTDTQDPDEADPEPSSEALAPESEHVPEAESEPGLPPSPPAAVPADQRRRNLLQQAAATIREFVAGRRTSLVWAVGENITVELLDAITEYQRAMAVIKEGEPSLESDEGAKSRSRLKRWWLLIVVAVLVFFLGGWLAGVALLLLAPAALVVLVVGWSIPFLRYHREMFRLQHRRELEISYYEHALESAEQSSFEILKLADRYVEFLDWAEILGGFVHRPWGQPATLAPSTVEMEMAGVPRAFTVARGFVQETKVRSLRARALRDILRTRWLSNQFDKVVEGVLNEFAETHGLRRDRELVEPEEDSRRGGESSREALRSAILEGKYSEQARSEMEQQVRAFCSRLTPTEIFEFAQVELRPDESPAKVSAKATGTRPGESGIRLAPLTNPATTGQLDVKAVVRAVLPSVVHLHVVEGDRASSGSGVVLTREGHIITNAHVVGTAQQVVVECTDGTVLDGTVLLARPDEDLALVKVDHGGLTPARRQHGQLLQVGEAVLAVGNPAGLRGGPSVTLGIVSALNRTIAAEERTLTGLIQTDAAISPGSSGGGLFDATGEFVGIPTAVRTDSQNIGYAISAQRALAVVGSMLGEPGSAAPEPEEAAPDPEPELRRPTGMAYTDMDAFFTDLAPGENEEFGRGSCWRESIERLGAPARSIIWAPEVVPDIAGPNVEAAALRPPVQLGRKLVYAACRLDLTQAVAPGRLAIFADDE